MSDDENLNRLQNENDALRKKLAVLEVQLADEKAHHLHLARENGSARQQILAAQREADLLRQRLASIAAVCKYPKARKPEDLPLFVAGLVRKD